MKCGKATDNAGALGGFGWVRGVGRRSPLRWDF